MNKTICLAIFCLWLCVADTSSHLYAQDHVLVSHTDDALGKQYAARIEAMLGALKETKYQAATEIDEANGSLKCDCSGLVGHILRHDFPEAYLSLRGKEAPWRKRAVAVTFYETFVAAGENGDGFWRRVTNLMEAAPGDVIAWRKEKVEAGSTTGHVCTIASQPELIGEGQVRVRLIDSTRAPHEDDTRPEGTFGVGAGFKTFLVNADGECVGYQVKDRPVKAIIAVGRIVRPTAATSHADDADFIGLSQDRAIELARKKGTSWRIVREDGIPKPINMQILEDRLNFVVEDGKIVAAYRG
jgi:hypothetical protein